jgi:serine/threonine protein kinase
MGVSLKTGALLRKRYRIIEILGQGGMGSVYRAMDENLGVEVAVKENLFTTEEYARQFRLEAVILANLRQPNLPRVTDHFVIAGQGQYLIIDYIEGEDLRQRMERTGSIEEEEAILIGVVICDALQYLHSRKPSVIHRDIKPGNVRITPDGHIYLVDFGLAKLVKGTQATTTGARAMTPGYSPPEQYGTARTDPRTDIYSLGATLYASLTGVVPEDGLSRAMENLGLTPIRQRNPKISRKLAAAIEKAMAVQPENRFQTAEEFKQALLNSNSKTLRLKGPIHVEPPPPEASKPLGGKPIHTILYAEEKEPPSHPPASARIKSQQWRLWILFSFLLLAGVLAVISFRSPLSQTLLHLFAASTATTFPTTTSTFTPNISPTPTATLQPTATSIGGGYSQIAFASDRAGAPQIFVMNADGSNPHQLTDLPNGACQPDWSPDGTRLVFISPCLKRQDQYPGAQLYIIKADGSGLVQLPSVEGGDFDPAWSPDNLSIAFASLRDGTLQIYVLSLQDSNVFQLTQQVSDMRLPDWSRQPAWTPSGTQIAYTGHSRLTDTLQIWVMSNTGRDPLLFVRSGSTYWDTLPVWSPDGRWLIFSQDNGPQVRGWLMKFDLENHQTANATKIRDFGINTDISPDSLWITYESLDIQNTNRTDFDIYRLGVDGKQFSRLTNDPSMDFDPDWRPIGVP